MFASEVYKYCTLTDLCETSKGMSRPKRESNHYNLMSDSLKLATERPELTVKHGRAFALYVFVHHTRLATKGKGKGKGKEKETEKERTKERQNDGETEKAEKAEKTAPPMFPPEIMEMIMANFGCTVFDLLQERQREVQFVNVKEIDCTSKFAHYPLRKAFPSIGEADTGYMYYERMDMSSYQNGQLTVSVAQRVLDDPSVKGQSLIWNVILDLNKVFIPEKRTSTIDVPEKAITVSTNVRRYKEYLKLSDARVEEMAEFRLKGEIQDEGKRIRFMSTSTGQDKGLVFDVTISTPHFFGRHLDTHSGFTVGDRVRLDQCYTRYKNFARGLEGVVRDIRMFTFALYYVELGDEDADVSKLVVKAHEKSGGLSEGQLKHHVACQWYQLKPVEGAAGGVGGV